MAHAKGTKPVPLCLFKLPRRSLTHHTFLLPPPTHEPCLIICLRLCPYHVLAHVCLCPVPALLSFSHCPESLAFCHIYLTTPHPSTHHYFHYFIRHFNFALTIIVHSHLAIEPEPRRCAQTIYMLKKNNWKVVLKMALKFISRNTELKKPEYRYNLKFKKPEIFQQIYFFNFSK